MNQPRINVGYAAPVGARVAPGDGNPAVGIEEALRSIGTTEEERAIRQAKREIQSTLSELELKTKRTIRSVEIVEIRGQSIAGGEARCIRHVELELSPAPAQNWSTP